MLRFWWFIFMFSLYFFIFSFVWCMRCIESMALIYRLLTPMPHDVLCSNISLTVTAVNAVIGYRSERNTRYWYFWLPDSTRAGFLIFQDYFLLLFIFSIYWSVCRDGAGQISCQSLFSLISFTVPCRSGEEAQESSRPSFSPDFSCHGAPCSNATIPRSHAAYLPPPPKNYHACIFAFLTAAFDGDDIGFDVISIFIWY